MFAGLVFHEGISEDLESLVRAPEARLANSAIQTGNHVFARLPRPEIVPSSESEQVNPFCGWLLA